MTLRGLIGAWVIVAALLWALTLTPPQWWYEAGKWTRAAILRALEGGGE